MSTLVVNTIKGQSGSTPPVVQNSSGTEIGKLCRAWVNFNGTGTVAIRDDFNVSTIGDDGTGDYFVNFTNALADNNYCVVTSGFNSGTGDGSWISTFSSNGTWGANSDITTAKCNIVSYNSGGSSQDNQAIGVAIFS